MSRLYTFLITLALVCLTALNFFPHDSVVVAYDTASRSVTTLYGHQGYGTAFAVKSPKGKTFLITNAHVCDIANASMMTVPYGKIQLPVKMIKQSAKYDLCALEAPKHLVPLSLGNEPYANQKLFATGFPLAAFLAVTEGRMLGIAMSEVAIDIEPNKCIGPKFRKTTELQVMGDQIVQHETCVMFTRSYYTSVHTDLGGSGSPLLDEDMNVVGVVYLVRGNIAFLSAVPVDDLIEFLNEL